MGKDQSWSWKGPSSSTKGENSRRQSMGCMAHMLHLFDFHLKAEQQRPQGLDLHYQSDDCHRSRKGLEAPRNSLEEEEGQFMAGPSSSSSSTGFKDEDEFYIPFSIQIPPFGLVSKSKLPSELPRNSPMQQSSPKTPSVVARLMGLDLLPPNTHHISSAASSPSFRRPSSSGRRSKGAVSSTSRHESGTKSLPDTPRVSLARRSDVEHRPSLQLNKDQNIITTLPELDFGMRSRESSPADYSSVRRAGRKKESSRLKPVLAGHDENRKLEIRSFGNDITNTSPHMGRSRPRNRDYNHHTSLPDCTNLKKARRIAREREETSAHSQSQTKNITASCIHLNPSSSPRTRAQFDHLAKNTLKSSVEDRAMKPLTSPPPKSLKQKKSAPPKLAVNCRKASCEKYTTSKPARRSSPHSQPLPQKIVTSKNQQKLRVEEKRVVPIVPSEEDHPPGLPDPNRFGPRDDSNELHYVRTILGRAGYDHLPVSVSFRRLHSPANPLDPSIFDFLEHNPDHYHDRQTRRLLFCLTNEILAHFLRPYICPRPWFRTRLSTLSEPMITGVELIDRTCTRIRSLPRAKCESLHDIDELIGSDIPDTDSTEEELEEISVDIGLRILDVLVDETVTDLRMDVSAAKKFDRVHLADLLLLGE